LAWGGPAQWQTADPPGQSRRARREWKRRPRRPQSRRYVRTATPIDGAHTVSSGREVLCHRETGVRVLKTTFTVGARAVESPARASGPRVRFATPSVAAKVLGHWSCHCHYATRRSAESTRGILDYALHHDGPQDAAPDAPHHQPPQGRSLAPEASLLQGRERAQ
jgi:hypothetical protein